MRNVIAFDRWDMISRRKKTKKADSPTGMTTNVCTKPEKHAAKSNILKGVTALLSGPPPNKLVAFNTLIANSLALNDTALTNALPIIVVSTPLKNPLMPFILYIFLTVSKTLSFLIVLFLVLLLLLVLQALICVFVLSTSIGYATNTPIALPTPPAKTEAAVLPKTDIEVETLLSISHYYFGVSRTTSDRLFVLYRKHCALYFYSGAQQQ
jgi:hypothetical protein